MLARLERIEALERRGAAAGPLLQELRELVREATAWAQRERDPHAQGAAAELAAALGPASHGLPETPLPWSVAAGPSPSDSPPHPVRR